MKITSRNPSKSLSVELAGERSLSEAEIKELHYHEVTIKGGLGTFFDVGKALAQIRQKRLYRETHGSFEAYCREKWDMSRMHAHRLVAAAEIRDVLAEKHLPLPQTESQVRVLAGVAKERIPSIWASVIKSAGKKGVTARLVGAVIEDLYPDARSAGSRNCLAESYGISLSNPQIPSNLTAARTNVYQVNIAWDALSGSENGFESYFIVERRASTNLPYMELATLSRTASSYLDAAAAPEIGYQYRLRALNDVSETLSSPIAATHIDSDNDGLADYLELILETNPAYADSDSDGLPDAWEVKFGLNPNSDSGRDGAAGDFDGDGKTNLEEFQNGTDPSTGMVIQGGEILQLYRP